MDIPQTLRIDIMVNFFSKITSQNGVLKLFAGGKQIKSLVPLIDVARCFKFMDWKEKILKMRYLISLSRYSYRLLKFVKNLIQK